MPKWNAAERAQLRSYAKRLRAILAPCDGWPRDTRAWARRDRIEVLIARIETDTEGATREDPARFLRLVAELHEWMRREHVFIESYPTFAIPEHWTTREGPSDLHRTPSHARMLQ